MFTIRAMTDWNGYLARHLEHSDYYAEGERIKGRWCGRGAELLGLQGDVRQEEFEALREGFDPETGAFLRQRQSAERMGADGEVQSHGRHLYDFTIAEIGFRYGACGRRPSADCSPDSVDSRNTQ